MTRRSALLMASVALASHALATADFGGGHATADAKPKDKPPRTRNVQLGTRPYCRVENMDDGPLKESLQACWEGPFRPSDFSIGHRGVAMQFPEHTKESYRAAARMGAGMRRYHRVRRHLHT